jgi:hypothetical protein
VTEILQNTLQLQLTSSAAAKSNLTLLWLAKTKTTFTLFRECTITLPSRMALYSDETKDIAFVLLGASEPISKQN